jgi:molybdenum cofactor guanylyltransferase
MRTAAILAGGAARRLGGLDKSRLLIGGRTILDRQLDLLGSLADRVMIIANDAARYADSGVTVVADRQPGAGSLGGIYTAVAEAASPVLVLACDMPFLTAPFLAQLWDAGRDVDVAIPRGPDGYHPVCAYYAPTCVEPMRRRIEAGALKVIDLLTEVRVRTLGPGDLAPFDPDGWLLANINTPDDLARAERAWQTRA